MTDPDGRRHLARAWVLAEHGRHRTHPNPLVGCVLTVADQVVGEGWTQPAGGRHAEIMALADAGPRARGATAWVTLEPCNHEGRTGPCTTALINAGVARIVLALDDPNPVAAGGRARLRAAGLDVEHVPWEAWIRHQNEVFVTNHEAGRPWIVLKLAATRSGEMVTDDDWITGTAARAEVHRRRAESDAVLVGSGTVLADDPRLDVRDATVLRGQPRPVLVDRRGRVDPTSRAVRPGTVILTDAHDDDWRNAVARAGAVLRAAGDDPSRWVTGLGDLGIWSVFAEPGPTLAAALCQAHVVDEVVLHQARGSGQARLPDALRGHRWQHVRTRNLGDDTETILRPLRS